MCKLLPALGGSGRRHHYGNSEYHNYGLIEINPRFRLPRATKHRDQSGSTRPPRHGKLRGLVRVIKCLVYMAVSDHEQAWLDRPPLFIDGKFRRRRSTTGRPGVSEARTFTCWACCASGSNTRRSNARCASSRTCSTPPRVLIEDKASGTQLIQELIADGCHRVTRYQPTTDKTMRLNAQTAIIENGFVYIPEAAPWLAEYLHEMTVFPNGKHDDQVDSTAQYLDWFKRPYP